MEPRLKTNPRRLQQCRVNQQKYRAQAMAATERLEAQVKQLTLETARLEGRLQSIRTAVPPPSYGQRLATEYFSAFRFGSAVHSEAQAAYLRQALSPHFCFQGRGGLAMFLDHWRRYTTFFDAFYMACDDMDVVRARDTELVTCTGRLSLRITEVTMEHVFPHLLGNVGMVAKLLGQGIELPLVVRFAVEPDGVATLDKDIGFAAGFVALLGSAEETALVLDTAGIDGKVNISLTPPF
ncbi:bzip transcription factor [Achlya hypogyna]|uniref:Bzip transcription factor n=1 Tax=Achlya hypogyna TaxID=1202772 RepID=A0A1V9YRD5_ACHHY|nr:bzip transcription factor [Achlya hypogyna]